MPSNDSDAQPERLSGLGANDGKETREVRSPPLVDGVPAWLSFRRATIPDRVTEYLERPALTQRCMPTNRPITMLQAPGGFGKTTLLAECCRVLTGHGNPTAWLTMDEQDEPSTLETYLVFAFQRAGLDVLGPLRMNEAGRPLPNDRIEALLRAVVAHGKPCVLALDELERVTDPASVALLDRLLKSHVPGLHLAMACRQLPPGLEIANLVFEGKVEVLAVEDLRFSKPDIGRFFTRKLSRRELAAVAADSGGWPIALRIERNARARRVQTHALVMRGVAYNWVESRLWRQIEEDDRDFLLDVGLLDWMDAELLDEALGGTGRMRRLESLSAVAGLLEPVRGSGGKVWRLHALIREYCAECRRRTPRRFRSIHRRVATALARRGETVAAMRHAAEAEDADLIGRILSDAGGIRLMLWEGHHHRLVAADRYLTEETLARYPRLALARSIAQVVNGRLRDARQTLDTVAAKVAGTLAGDVRWDVDWCMARTILAHNACEPIGSEPVRHLASEHERLAKSSDVEPPVRALMEYALCQRCNQKAEFDTALERADRARRWLDAGSESIANLVDLQVGQIAMAQGRVQDANALYQGLLRNGTEDFLNDPRMVIFGKVLTWELDLERNRISGNDEVTRIPGEFWQTGSQFASYAAASAVAAELTLADRGVEEALSVVNQMLNHAYQAELPSLIRYLAGLRIAVLAEAGQVEEAERSWRIHVLPTVPAECLDLKFQSWREMEMLSCARLRLFIASGEFDDGQGLVRSLLEVASRRGLRRTLMRTLALATVLEEAAGNRAAAMSHLSAYVELFVQTDYARALVRERSVAVTLLTAFLDTDPDAPLRNAAQALLEEAAAGRAVTVPALSDREAEILARLNTQTDQQIGAALGITRYGVRYHLQNLFQKLGVRNRGAAVQRARSLGLAMPNPP